MSPLLAALHIAELTTILPVTAAGAVAVYVLLPRPRPLPWWIGGALAAIAVLLAGATILHTGAVTPETFLFYAFSAIAVVSGGLLVTQHNPARAALSFTLVILSTCGLFLLLAAPFLAVATIIIYAGAIIVTFLFVLMLAQQAGLGDADARSREPLLATITGFILLGALLYVLQLSYKTNETIEVIDQTLVLTRDAKTHVDTMEQKELEQKELNDLLAKLKEPVNPLIDAAAPNSARSEDLKKVRNSIEDTVGAAKSDRASIKAALDDLKQRLFAMRYEQVWPQQNTKARVFASDFSGPSANEPATNLRYDDQGRPRMPADNSAYLGRALFTDYLLPVELGGFLLLIAAVGSIAIAHRRTTSERSV